MVRLLMINGKWPSPNSIIYEQYIDNMLNLSTICQHLPVKTEQWYLFLSFIDFDTRLDASNHFIIELEVSIKWQSVEPAGDKENAIVLPNGENRHVGQCSLLLNVNSFTQSASEC